MEHERNTWIFAWIAVFLIAAATVGSAQIDFSGMIDGVVGEVQNAVNDAFNQARGWPSARPQGDRDMGRRGNEDSYSEAADYSPSYETPSYGGYGASPAAAAPSQDAPMPIAGQDNAFAVDFGGGSGGTAGQGAAWAAQGNETVSVKGRGMGTNREEALRDAYRDAIERAVGLYVDAEQMMKNEQLVQDQILTHSNAYIERYDVIKEETRPNGLTEIQILAVVKKSALTRKLSDVMPSQSFQVGNSLQNLHAQSVTSQKRGEDAVALLQNVLKDANPITQLMKVSLSRVPPRKGVYEDNSHKEKELIYFRFNVTVDEQKYFGEFLPPLLAVFDQIAQEKPKTVFLQAKEYTPNSLEHIADYLAGKYKESESSFGRGRVHIDILDPDSANNGVMMGIATLGNGDYTMDAQHGDISPGWFGKSDLEEQGCFHALVITKMNATRSVVQARHYRLPLECASVLLKWQEDICRDRKNVRDRTIDYNVIFADAQGEEVAAYPISFENKVLCNFAVGGTNDGFFGGSTGFGIYLTPMVSMKAKSRERWVGFDLPREMLPLIKSVKIELAE